MLRLISLKSYASSVELHEDLIKNEQYLHTLDETHSMLTGLIHDRLVVSSSTGNGKYTIFRFPVLSIDGKDLLDNLKNPAT